MPKKMRAALVVAKLETAYGTDSAPVGANAILCRGITPTPIAAEYAERTLVRSYLGANGSLPAAVHSEIEFEVELAGAGAAGSAPKWGALMRACGFAETLSAGVSAVYAPVSSTMESVTIHYFLDGLKHAISGARGSVSFALNAKGIPTANFKFIGKYLSPTDTPNLTPDYSGFQIPKVVGKKNTPTFTLFGQSVAVETFSIDVANEVVFRSLINSETVEIVDRKPTGAVAFELGNKSTYDWWGAVENVTKGALELVHGTAAGNIIEIDAAGVTLREPGYSDSSGIAMFTANLAFEPTAGNDDLILTVR